MGYHVKERLGSNDGLCCITIVNDTALTDGRADIFKSSEGGGKALRNMIRCDATIHR